MTTTTVPKKEFEKRIVYLVSSKSSLRTVVVAVILVSLSQTNAYYSILRVSTVAAAVTVLDECNDIETFSSMGNGAQAKNWQPRGPLP